MIIALVVLLFIVILFAIYTNLKLHKSNSYIALEPDRLDACRKDSLRGQESSLRGAITEHYSILMPNWKYRLDDGFCITGTPIDFIVFNGLSDGCVKEIVLIDAKTGDTRARGKGQVIKRFCLDKPVVRYEIYQMPKPKSTGGVIEELLDKQSPEPKTQKEDAQNEKT